ncbi:MAG: NfeD family protein [Alphaproteobacteria bacterium]|jgi:inner membrane protein|nr:NfeD family protein [Alphaproteobacteria bacterium]
MEQIFTELTVWHWLALGLVLFGIEMMTGTFDLMMLSIAAWLTGAFAFFGPDTYTSWQGQLVFFGAAAFVLVALGRTLFSGLRGTVEEHPTLNKRMAGLIGQRGQATGDFSGGNGQIKVGDSVWGAEAADRMIPIRAGDSVIVEGARKTIAIVRKV